MSIIQQPLFSLDDYGDKRPLPLIVASKWGFDLISKEHNGEALYRAHDWLTGMVGKRFADQAIRNYRRPGDLFEKCVYDVHTFEETDGRNRKRDIEYVTDVMLYRLTQDLVGSKNVPESAYRIESIKTYLARSGAFTDKVRVDPVAAVARIQGMAGRDIFTNALAKAVIGISPYGYATATNIEYKKLFGRDTKQLKRELETDSIRDKMSPEALYMVGLCESLCARRIGERQHLTLDEALAVIADIGGMLGLQVDEIERSMGMDFVTGRHIPNAVDAIRGA